MPGTLKATFLSKGTSRRRALEVPSPYVFQTGRSGGSVQSRSPESWFEDFGEGKLVKGKAEVKIDPDFAKTVDLKTRYHVFVTPHSTKISALAVVARLPGRFRVEHPGGASGTFSYRVVDKRADMQRPSPGASEDARRRRSRRLSALTEFVQMTLG